MANEDLEGSQLKLHFESPLEFKVRRPHTYPRVKSVSHCRLFFGGICAIHAKRVVVTLLWQACRGPGCGAVSLAVLP